MTDNITDTFGPQDAPQPEQALTTEQLRLILLHATRGHVFYRPTDFDCDCGVCSYCCSGTLPIPVDQLARDLLAESEAHAVTRRELEQMRAALAAMVQRFVQFTYYRFDKGSYSLTESAEAKYWSVRCETCYAAAEEVEIADEPLPPKWRADRPTEQEKRRRLNRAVIHREDCPVGTALTALTQEAPQ